ncbi:MAG: hypothetical protein MZU79_00145 [Anaerotruncus sp.]|nr:hypothetical protein [Anaerotruncus sp.]
MNTRKSPGRAGDLEGFMRYEWPRWTRTGLPLKELGRPIVNTTDDRRVHQGDGSDLH